MSVGNDIFWCEIGSENWVAHPYQEFLGIPPSLRAWGIIDTGLLSGATRYIPTHSSCLLSD